ncbi:hypothetical protein BDB01DRAFT_849927 [Pilobolus umbonatus]|nr:hypothetical protein BDB01DRAFT_849927 [Pilobolus umbonatus]
METGEMTNHDICDACGGVGQFICCDACPNAFHFTCVEPPLNISDVENLKGKWYCKECDHTKKKRRIRTERGLFQHLMEDMSTRNPRTYKLPDDIIHFFKGVAADKEGKYIDTTQMKHTKPKNGTYEYNYNRLKDRNGGFLQCYYCRKTAMNKPLIACDYCSLHWHLDCLNPPLASSPNSTKRWRCPNHIENILGTKRQQKKPTVFKADHSACAYYSLMDTIIEDEIKPKTKAIKMSHKSTPTENMITSKDGKVYILPVESFQLDLSHIKKSHEQRQSSKTPTMISSSYSDISSPPTSLSPLSIPSISQTNDKQAINWYRKEDDDLLTLVRKATQLTVPTSPIPNEMKQKVPLKQYQRYRQIKQLLQQKDEKEILSLLSN